jgi:hypothetical protein
MFRAEHRGQVREKRVVLLERSAFRQAPNLVPMRRIGGTRAPSFGYFSCAYTKSNSRAIAKIRLSADIKGFKALRK